MVDDDLRQLDEHINRLFPEARTIVVAHYVWLGPVKAKLDRVRASRTRYYDLLEMAHKQLGHWMGDGYDMACQHWCHSNQEARAT